MRGRHGKNPGQSRVAGVAADISSARERKTLTRQRSASGLANSGECAMKCEAIGELLPDYLQGRLSSDLAVEVEKHLAGCAACGEEAALWKKLTLLPEEQPSPAVESRFKAMLERYQEGRWEKTSLAAEKSKTPPPMLWGLGNWRQLPAAGIVWACLFLVCGFLIGRHSARGPD